MQGHVRAILVEHAGGPVADDPNRLEDAGAFQQALARHAPLAQRTAGGAYASLWARTFPTLVRHLRGRPERMLALLCDEVIPFLRGDRLSARLDGLAGGEATILLAPGLPAAWVEGFVEASIGHTGAQCSVEHLGGDRFRVRFHLGPRDRLVALLAYLSSLRVPLLLCSALAAILGIAVAADTGPEPLSWWRVLLVLFGVVSAQAGANAWHELRRAATGGPLGPPRPQPPWWRFQAIGGYAVAAAAGVLLAIDRPWVIAFALVGLLVSLGYPRAQRDGWGPLLAAFTYGPLILLGAEVALEATPFQHAAESFLACIVAGAAAGAALWLDDMADRPLDEAGGRRTLLVVLPRGRQAVAYATMLGFACLAAAGLAPMQPVLLPALLAIAIGCAVLVRRVVAEHDDPHGLAPLRLATTGIQVMLVAWCCGALLAGV